MSYARSTGAPILRGPGAAAWLLGLVIASSAPPARATAVRDSLAVGGIRGLAPSPYT